MTDTQLSFFDLDTPTPVAIPARKRPARMPSTPPADAPRSRTRKSLPTKYVLEATVVTVDGDVLTIRFPAPSKILTTNTAKGWRQESSHKKRLRDLMYAIAEKHDFQTGWTRARIVVLIQHPMRKKVRDNPNFHQLMVKPLVDALGRGRIYTIRQGKNKGLVVEEKGWGLLEGDDAGHLGCEDCPHIRLGEPTGTKNTEMPFGQLTVTVTNLSGRES